MNSTTFWQKWERRGAAVDRRALAIWLAPAVIVFGTLLRFLTLGAKSYWLDEIVMLRVAQGSLSTLLSAAGDGRPPVFVLMAHYWLQWFGTSEFAARSLSAVFGSLALIPMYLVGKDLLGRRAALVGTFIMSVAEFQIYQSQDFRYYAVFMFFGLVSFYAFWRALHTGRFAYWAVYVVSSIATFYSHTHGIFLIAAQGLFYFIMFVVFRRYRPILLPWLASQVLIGAGILPGLYIAFFSTVGGKANVFQWIPKPTLGIVVKTLAKFVLPGRHLPTKLAIAGGLIFGITAVALYVLYVGRNRWEQAARALPDEARALSFKRPVLILLACWLVVPIALPFVGSYVFGPMFLDRYVIGASPALYLIMALVMVTIRKVVPVAVPVAMLVIIITPGLAEYYTTPTKEQWREAAQYINSNVQGSDHFVFAPGENGAIQDSLAWYYQASMPGCGIEATTRTAAAIAQQLPSCLNNAPRFWLVIRGLPDRVQPYRDYFLTNTPANMHLVKQQHFTDIDLYLFSVNPG